jgi:hypothetical protein
MNIIKKKEGHFFYSDPKKAPFPTPKFVNLSTIYKKFKKKIGLHTKNCCFDIYLICVCIHIYINIEIYVYTYECTNTFDIYLVCMYGYIYLHKCRNLRNNTSVCLATTHLHKSLTENMLTTFPAELRTSKWRISLDKTYK